LLPDIAASGHSKKRPCFLEVILQHLKTESITCQEGRYEARRIIRFDDIFLCDPVNMPGSIRRIIGLLQKARIVDQNAPLTNQMKLFGKGAGAIQYRTVFLKLSASSTPPFRVAVFSFLLHPPHLPPVNRLSIRLPPRFSVKLENSFYILLSFDPVGIYP